MTTPTNPNETGSKSVDGIEQRARELLDSALRKLGLHEDAYHIGCGGDLDPFERASISAIIAALRTAGHRDSAEQPSTPEQAKHELLPCPFCGPGQSIVDVYFDDVARRFRVGCGRCGASSGIHPTDKTEAPVVSAWNSRAPGAAQDPVLRRLLGEARNYLEGIELADDIDRALAGQEVGAEAAYETVEVRLNDETTKFIEQAAADAGVTREQAASVITVIALRKYLREASETPVPVERREAAQDHQADECGRPMTYWGGKGPAPQQREGASTAPLRPVTLSRHSRAMLLNVLWHHQGGSSAVGQSLRTILGVGRHDRLNAEQVSEAKWIDGLLSEMASLTAELHLLEEVCAFYANDEDRFLREEGEAYGLIPTEVGLAARVARKRFQERSRLAGEGA